jgi:hypothetical protein
MLSKPDVLVDDRASCLDAIIINTLYHDELLNLVQPPSKPRYFCTDAIVIIP